MLHASITLAEDEQDGFRNQIVGGGLYSMNAFVYKWRKIFLLQFVSVHIIFFYFCLIDQPYTLPGVTKHIPESHAIII